MYNFDKDVLDWNKERGFIPSPFDIGKETGYVLSEVLEALNWEKIKELIKIGVINDVEFDSQSFRELEAVKSHDDMARWIIKYFMNSIDKYNEVNYCDMVTDIEVFSVGGRGKIGLNATGINQIRKVVMDKNHFKKPGDVDEHGKQKKGENWQAPEDIIKHIIQHQSKNK